MTGTAPALRHRPLGATAACLRAAFCGGLLAAVAAGAPLAAHAGLLDDDEARRAILDLRQKLDQSNELQRQRAEQANAKIEQLRRSLLDISNQLQQMRDENAKLRGQDEQLARDLSEVQRKQKDIQSGVDDRLRKFEPQTVTVDGKEFTADPDEKRQYDEALALLRKSDFIGTVNALTAFRKRYPGSGYNDAVLFWLGNAQYGERQYKDSIASFRALVTGAPTHPKAPEALLAIANCQAEMKDGKSARRTIDDLIRLYPQSEAAQAGRERLASLKS